MKHYPAQRPARVVCLECGHERDRHGPSWRLFWCMLAMGLIALSSGLLLAVALWHAP